MALEFGMTHDDVIIFEKNKIEKKNPKSNIYKKNLENQEVSSPYHNPTLPLSYEIAICEKVILYIKAKFKCPAHF